MMKKWLLTGEKCQNCNFSTFWNFHFFYFSNLRVCFSVHFQQLGIEFVSNVYLWPKLPFPGNNSISTQMDPTPMKCHIYLFDKDFVVLFIFSFFVVCLVFRFIGQILLLPDLKEVVLKVLPCFFQRSTFWTMNLQKKDKSRKECKMKLMIHSAHCNIAHYFKRTA